PKELEDPTSRTLQAVVSLGGCSASFVSAEGLVVTNHHCAIAALQTNSVPGKNLLKDGFAAKNRADEKSNGPTARIFVTDKVSDVTTKVRLDLDKQKDDRARYKLVEARQKEIVADCEKGRPGTRCSVAPFYEGSMFYLVEQLEIRDVRLVLAPEAGVGNYGGEIDNWRWPRHTGDFTFFRAYVGKDGKPADFSPDNVPYKPKSHLRFATTPLRESDLVMVAGYPGRTYSGKTKAEVEEAVGFGYPRRQKLCEDYLAALDVVSKADPAAAIVATPLVRRYGNALTNTKGQLEGLVKDGLLGLKAKREEELRAAGPKVAQPLDEIAKLVLESKKTREADAELLSEFLSPKLLSAAHLIVKMAEERGKPDA
ncbi:MAG: S46 family peptidase, partial [Proteobacteria bacterium]